MSTDARGTCPKCTRPFKRLGKYYDDHVAKCNGKPWVTPTVRSASSKPRIPASILDPTLREIKLARDSVDQAIARAERELETLKAEKAALDSAVEPLEEARKK